MIIENNISNWDTLKQIRNWLEQLWISRWQETLWWLSSSATKRYTDLFTTLHQSTDLSSWFLKIRSRRNLEIFKIFAAFILYLYLFITLSAYKVMNSHWNRYFCSMWTNRADAQMISPIVLSPILQIKDSTPDRERVSQKAARNSDSHICQTSTKTFG